MKHDIEALKAKLVANRDWCRVALRRAPDAILPSEAAVLEAAGVAEWQRGGFVSVAQRSNFGRTTKVVSRYSSGICILK